MIDNNEELFLWTESDGGVSVFIPTENVSDKFVRDNIAPINAINIRKTKRSNFPIDRLFRNAWDDSNPEDHVGLNMGKAKLIAHDIRREKRDVAFAKNADIIDKVSKGIPLKAGEDGSNALIENAAYKSTVDDVAQINIDNANNEPQLRAALNKLI